MTASKTLLGKGLAVLLYTQILELYNGGNIASQFLGFICQAWILVAVIIIGALIITRSFPPGRWALPPTNAKKSR